MMMLTKLKFINTHLSCSQIMMRTCSQTRNYKYTHIMPTHVDAQNIQIYEYTCHFDKIVIYKYIRFMFTNYKAHLIVICNHAIIILTNYKSHNILYYKCTLIMQTNYAVTYTYTFLMLTNHDIYKLIIYKYKRAMLTHYEGRKLASFYTHVMLTNYNA